MIDSRQIPLASFPQKRSPLWTPRVAALFGFASVAGLAVVQGVGRWKGPGRAVSPSYFISWPLERAFASNTLTGITLGMLFTIGLVCGAVHPRRAWLLGFATVALFPIVVAIEIARDGTSHNLFPFEFVMFVFLALPAVAGAAAAAGMRMLWTRRGNAHGVA